jgi:hypothetical protein
VRVRETAKGPNGLGTREEEIGDVQKGFAEADEIVEYTIKRAANSPAGVEAMACVAQWRGEFLDIWVHHQNNPQPSLSSSPGGRSGAVKGRKPNPGFTHWSKITVTLPYQGSWFGGLSWIGYSDLFVRLAVILAKRAAGKPVKLLYDESHLGYSAYGAYGIGENVGASLSGITSSAIYNAIGKWVLDFPTTPDKVLKALGKT